MNRTNRQDMFLLCMGIDTLLECVRQMEEWWRACGDSAALRRTQQLGNTILATRRKIFGDTSDSDTQIARALIVAEALREAATHCDEGQAALNARLIGGAEVIEQLCRTRKT